MKRVGWWIALAAQLGVVAVWLMSGWAYLAAPPAMARALGMPDTLRDILGSIMLVLAIVPLVGLALRNAATATAGTVILAVEGAGWTIYAAARHWVDFVAFFAVLTVVTVGVLVARSRLP